MKKGWKIFLAVIIVILLITGLVCSILITHDDSKKDNITIDTVLDNLPSTTKITIEDTMSLNKKVYTITEQEEIDKITSLLSSITNRSSDTIETSRYVIKLFVNDKEYADLSFYPFKIKGYNEKLTLNENESVLYELLINNYSVKFPEINSNAEKILKNVTQIEVEGYIDKRKIKTIKDINTIEKINNIILDAKVDENTLVNAISQKYTLIFLDKNNTEVARLIYDPYLLLNIDGENYKLIKYDGDTLSKLIEK